MEKQKIPEKLFSTDTESKFLYIRHGETVYNKAKKEKDKKEFENDRFTNPEYIDCHLTEKGIKDGKLLQSKINSLDIEAVYVSPLYRSLQTCLYALQNHPNKKDIIVKVNPLIGEKINGLQELVADIEENKRDFNMNSDVKFDWSLFDEFNEKYNKGKNQSCYYFDFIDNMPKEDKEKWFDKFNSIQDKEVMKKEVCDFGIYRKEILKTLFESIYHLFNRSLEFKQFLAKEHCNTLNDTKKKVLVFSHGTYIRLNTSVKAYDLKPGDNEDPDDITMIKNGEIISVYL